MSRDAIDTGGYVRTLFDMDMLAAPMTGLEWDHLVEDGTLDGPYELVGGRKMRQMTEHSAHAGIVNLMRALLVLACPVGLDIRMGNPIALGPVDRPEPDLAVVNTRDDFYVSAHPEPDDVHLVVEVSASSLRLDLGEKATRYGLAGINEYWVVDILSQVTVVHVTSIEDKTHWNSIIRVPFGAAIESDTLVGPVVVPSSALRDEAPG